MWEGLKSPPVWHSVASEQFEEEDRLFGVRVVWVYTHCNFPRRSSALI